MAIKRILKQKIIMTEAEKTESVWDKNAKVIAHEIDKLILEEMREEHPEFFNKIILNTE